MRDDGLPLAHIAIAVEGASVSSPDIVTLMVANAIIGSYDLTYGGGKVGKCLVSFSSGLCSFKNNSENLNINTLWKKEKNPL